MRALVVVVGLAVVVAGVAFAVRSGLFAADAAPGAPGETPASAAAPSPDRSVAATPVASSPGNGAAIALRTQATSTPTAEVSDGPTACLQVVDYATQRPIAGAIVRRVRSGGDLGFSDQRGLAPLPLPGLEQLAVCADGYLLRMVPTRPGSSEQSPQSVSLVRDEWSRVRRLQFRTAGGACRGDVFVRLHPAADATQASVPSDPVIQRAWSEHTTLLGLPVCADIASCPANYDPERVLRLRDGAAVAFAVAGHIVLEAATTDGFVARQTIAVEPNTTGAPIEIVLAPGAVANGTVRDRSDGQPIAGAVVTIGGGDPLGLLATTTAEGAFSIGPLPTGAVVLDVRHGAYEPAQATPSANGAVEVRLQPLPGHVLRGRVRARPDLAPVGGATVAWLPAQGAKVTTQSGADGSFALRVSGDADARLAVQADGYQFLTELLSPEAPAQDYDLWPAVTAVRLAKSLTACLAGVVLDASGAPIADAAVRWVPAVRASPVAEPGRRVLDGGTLVWKQSVPTAGDGTFVLETDQFGPGRLMVTGGSAEGFAAEAIAGRTIDGLRLRR